MDIKKMLLNLKKRLSSKGYIIEENAKILGKSGIEHHFDIVIKDKNKENIYSIYIVDVLNTINLINMFAKLVDTNISQIVISEKIESNILEESYKLPTKILIDLEKNIFIAVTFEKNRRDEIFYELIHTLISEN
ncbi:MAG: hypothetical protein J7K23_09690 [Thermoproteales archaeon]|nr:hypothetical protein [Thermoproteales archaeon]